MPTAPLPLTQRNHEHPARDLAGATRLCDPYSPLDAENDESLHVDFDPLRGGPRLNRISRTIQRGGSTTTLHFLSGHMGSGKTTELRRLARDLPLQKLPGTLPVQVLYVDADQLLDHRDIEVEDILMAIWGKLAAQSVSGSFKALIELWTKQFVTQLTQLMIDVPQLAQQGVEKLLGQIKLSPPEQRVKLRGLIASNAQALVRGLNEAIETLRGTGDDASSVAIFIDNLEKLALADRKSVEHLYLNRLGALKQLDAHLVITVPLFLIYSAEGAGLTGLWGGDTVVLPMVKVRERRAPDGTDGAPYEKGLEAIADMLERRVNFAALFEGGHDAALKIAGLSGGCPRHALRLTTVAMQEHDAPPVALASIERAAATITADFDRALEERLIKLIVHVGRTGDFDAACEPDTKRALLRNLFVLEYQNGDPAPWFGVHPLVERVPRYAAARSLAERT